VSATKRLDIFKQRSDKGVLRSSEPDIYSSMNKKRPSESAFFNRRALIPLILCIATVGTLLGFLRPEAPKNNSQRTLTFAERVTYQRAVEEVYWRHRIWPKENLNPKPSLDSVMSQAQLEKKVEDYLRSSEIQDSGIGQSPLKICRLRWIGWPRTPNNPRCCTNSLMRWGMIRLL
jgi:hypothetical protein